MDELDDFEIDPNRTFLSIPVVSNMEDHAFQLNIDDPADFGDLYDEVFEPCKDPPTANTRCENHPRSDPADAIAGFKPSSSRQPAFDSARGGGNPPYN